MRGVAGNGFGRWRAGFRAGALPWLALAALVSLSGCAAPQFQTETVYRWRTWAGQAGGLGNVDGKGESARFCQPSGVAIDGAGNVYVADYYNYAIRKIAPDGTVTTLAGSVGDPGGNDGTGNAARFDRPLGLSADAAGNLYVADSGNHAVRKVSPEGAVTTLAGAPGSAGYADGTGREARFRSPCDVAVDGAGNVYVADAYNHVIRKVTPAGTVTTLAGKVELKSGMPAGGCADGKGGAARFRCPRGVAVDGAGNVYVADSDNAVVRKISADGTVRTLAGSAGNAGNANGTNAVARFSCPQGVAVDAAGTLYVADTGNQTIRRVTPAGMVSTVTNAAGRFASPRDVAVDRSGNLVVADNESQTVSKFAPKGGVTVLAGSMNRSGCADGKGVEVRFNRPCGVASGPGGSLYVADNFSHVIRRVAPDGVVTTFAGKAWASGSADGAGGAARFFWPSGLCADGAGNLVVADAGNHTLRKVSPDGTATTLAGSAGSSGWADGSVGKARFSWPSDVAADGAGNLLVADRGNHVIRKVTSAGEVTTFAGAAGKAGRSDGVGGAARFNAPSGVAVDSVGNVYVADTGNHLIRKVMPGGEVTTLAGCVGIKGNADGQGVLARFNGPSAVAVDAAGNVFVADRDNHTVRRVAPDGTVTTLGGAPNMMSAAEGIGGVARFAQPSGLAIGNSGTLWVADACNNRIVEGEPFGEPKRLAVVEVGAGRKGAAAPDAAAAAEAVVPYVWAAFAGQPGNAGSDDGTGRQAKLCGPQGIALGANGNLVVADGRDSAIRRISADGKVTTVGVARGRLSAPIGVAAGGGEADCTVVDAARVLWKVAPSGKLSKVAELAAQSKFIAAVAVDAAGNAYLADYHACVIRKVTPAGEVTVFAGCEGLDGTVDGVGGAARFDRPSGIARDRAGNLFVAAGNKIRRVTPTGAVTTVAGDAPFGRLDGIAADAAGNVYAADRGCHAIWKVTPQGEVSKLGGSELAMGGSGWLVTGLAVDRDGNVYVADSVRNCVTRGRPRAK